MLYKYPKIQNYKRNCIQHVNRIPRNRLPRLIKKYTPKGSRNQGRDFWVHETGMGQQVVQLVDSYMMMKMINI
jgi:hypothetical protein